MGKGSEAGCPSEAMSLGLEHLTPSDLDTQFLPLWQREASAEQRVESARRRVERFPRSQPDLERAEAELQAVREELAPLHAEWRRRGGWARGYLVVSSDHGHVHSSTHCSTCNFRTRYTVLPDLSDLSADELVARIGFRACTVCYPDAPLHPAWIRGQEEAEAAEQAKQDARCPGSGEYMQAEQITVRGMGRWAACPSCGETMAVTDYGKIRAHKRPGARKKRR